jgi:hypothetical protein
LIDTTVVLTSTDHIDGPTISGSIPVLANRLYSVQIQLLVTDLDGHQEYASSITMGSISFGTCKTPGVRQCSCDYGNCSSLAHSTISTTSATLPVRIEFTKDVDPLCAPKCTANSNKVSVAARITLSLGM